MNQPSLTGSFHLRKIAHVGQSFKIAILRPEGGVAIQGNGVDEGIGEGKLVFDEKIGGGNRDFFIDGNNDAGSHGLGHFFGLTPVALFEDHFADFGDHDGGDDELGQRKKNGAEVDRVGTAREALKPCGGVEDIGFHAVLQNSRSASRSNSRGA